MSEYQVRLILDITADTPEDAVETFIEVLVSHGLRNWKYKVTDQYGEDLLIWGNTLEEVTREELLADIAENTAAREANVPTSESSPINGVEPGTDENEDAALALAEDLARRDAEADSQE